jgi:hypothetical protein
MDPYTHTFKFFVGTNGENTIAGECEFDSDNKMTFKVEDTSDPFPSDTLSSFLEVMNLLKKIYDTTGGIRQITIKSKLP